jgi:hypothetical protein
LGTWDSGFGRQRRERGVSRAGGRGPSEQQRRTAGDEDVGRGDAPASAGMPWPGLSFRPQPGNLAVAVAANSAIRNRPSLLPPTPAARYNTSRRRIGGQTPWWKPPIPRSAAANSDFPTIGCMLPVLRSRIRVGFPMAWTMPKHGLGRPKWSKNAVAVVVVERSHCPTCGSSCRSEYWGRMVQKCPGIRLTTRPTRPSFALGAGASTAARCVSISSTPEQVAPQTVVRTLLVAGQSAISHRLG